MGPGTRRRGGRHGQLPGPRRRGDAAQHAHRLALDHRGRDHGEHARQALQPREPGAIPNRPIEVIRQPGNVAWTIFNETAHNVALQFSHQREAVEAGAIRVAETFDELAAITDVPGDALAETVGEVNDILAGRKTDPFGREFGDKAPLEPPYYAVRVTGALFHTQGGLVIDPEAEGSAKGHPANLSQSCSPVAAPHVVSPARPAGAIRPARV